MTPPSPLIAVGPSQDLSVVHGKRSNTVIMGIGIAVTAVAALMLAVLISLIRRKSKELEDCEKIDKTSSKVFSPHPMRKFQEGRF